MLITKWHDGIFGFAVGDALGVPVQFMSREEIKKCPEGPVTGMRGGGVFNMPAGTWSDDTSMTYATMESLEDKWDIDLESIADEFVYWLLYNWYTPADKAFDIGNTCRTAIMDFKDKKDVRNCGVKGEYANGNGALMRILPICLFDYDRMKDGKCDIDKAIKDVHEVGSLTHNHLRSNMCCGFYFFMVKAILDGKKNKSNDTLSDLLQKGIDDAKDYYSGDDANLTEMKTLERIMNLKEFAKVKEEAIKSSGYVIDTVEAAVWCLITTENYKECMLKAVNLGDDTDTVAAIAGGLAGLFYGYEAIPEEWLEVIPMKDEIDDLCVDLGDEKFRFGLDPKPYRDTIYNFTREKFSWASDEYLEGIMRIEIEKIDGEYQFVRYITDEDGHETRYVDDEIHTTYRFFLRRFDELREMAAERIKVLDTYCAPFFGRDLSHGYRLERYEISKLATGDYSVLIQEGDRVSGGAFTVYIAKDSIVGKTFEEAVKAFPKEGVTDEDLLNDEGLKKFLGYDRE